MKKLFLTMLVALFATAVLGQPHNYSYPSRTTGQIFSPFNELPQCFKDYITKNYSNFSITYAQAVHYYSQKVVIGVNKTTGAKIYGDPITDDLTYEVSITTVAGGGIKPTPKITKILSSTVDCKTVIIIPALSQNIIH